MSDALFHSVIFGPLRSRRLGLSLGINLLSTKVKFCTFNCIYCECGFTDTSESSLADLPAASVVISSLQKKLEELKARGIVPDAITYAGNGEPTSHPEFPAIVDETVALRDAFFPDAKVSVLSNSTNLSNDLIIKALLKTQNIMKLDAGSEEMFRLINQPQVNTSLTEIVNNLKKFNGNLTIQTMFLKGVINNKAVDNTISPEIDLWMEHVRQINPRQVMIYSIDRTPPLQQLQKVTKPELDEIAVKLEKLNIKTSVY